MLMLDNRLGNCPTTFADHLTEPHEWHQLDSGDVCFVGNGPGGSQLCGIELKKLPDFLSSVHSGRLFGHQLPLMTAAYDRCYLVLQGIWRVNTDTGAVETFAGRWVPARGEGNKVVLGSELWGLLLNALTMFGCATFYTANDRETARLVEALYRWWAKPWTAHHAHEMLHCVEPAGGVFTPPTVLRCIAAQLPGVGAGRSRAVEQHFGSVSAMMAADEAAWREVPGIGKRGAEKIMEALR